MIAKIKCIYCFGAGREIIRTPLITLGRFGIFRENCYKSQSTN